MNKSNPIPYELNAYKEYRYNIPSEKNRVHPYFTRTKARDHPEMIQGNIQPKAYIYVVKNC